MPSKLNRQKDATRKLRRVTREQRASLKQAITALRKATLALAHAAREENSLYQFAYEEASASLKALCPNDTPYPKGDSRNAIIAREKP